MQQKVLNGKQKSKKNYSTKNNSNNNKNIYDDYYTIHDDGDDRH